MPYKVKYLHSFKLDESYTWDGTDNVIASSTPCVDVGDRIGLSSDPDENFFDVLAIDGLTVTIENIPGIPISSGPSASRVQIDCCYEYMNPQDAIAVKVFAVDPNLPSKVIHVEDLSVGDMVCVGGFVDPHPQLGEISPNKVLSIVAT